VWEEHLLPLLTCKDAARLGSTCRALRVVIREHFLKNIGGPRVNSLRPALTTFPRLRSVLLEDHREECEVEEKEALVDWLREGGRGSHLLKVQTKGESASDLVHTALREGALPSLNFISVKLHEEMARASLTEGFLGAMSALFVELSGVEESQLAALGLVRQLPALTWLELKVDTSIFEDDEPPVEWPPFIPPSIERLFIDLQYNTPSSEALLPALPGMLAASGASRLRCLEILVPEGLDDLDDGLIYLAETLRYCAPTVKAFILTTAGNLSIGDREGDNYRAERAGGAAARAVGGASGGRVCLPRAQGARAPKHHGRVLVPARPALPSTACLTQLEIWDHEREHPRQAGVMGLWEVMASGGLPALAKLKVALRGRWGGVEEVRTRVALALEAVADTLTHLHLGTLDEGLLSDQVVTGYELGVAVSKLRGLKDLLLHIFNDGRAYQAMAQGLAASEGDRPLPLLWRIRVFSLVHANADLLVGLLLPSVRVFGFIFYEDARATLLAACAVRRAGYKHILILYPPGQEIAEGLSIVRPIVPGTFGDADNHGFHEGWCVSRLTFPV
jgi:hypothetical protein